MLDTIQFFFICTLEETHDFSAQFAIEIFACGGNLNPNEVGVITSKEQMVLVLFYEVAKIHHRDLCKTTHLNILSWVNSSSKLKMKVYLQNTIYILC